MIFSSMDFLIIFEFLIGKIVVSYDIQFRKDKGIIFKEINEDSDLDDDEELLC